MHQAMGSYSGSVLHTHPLNDDRAKNLAKYAAAVQQYVLPGEINPDHEKLLTNNSLYTYQKPTAAKAGEGGGFSALLETVANSYSEAIQAKTEQHKRKIKQFDQQRLANLRLLFSNLRIANASGGGQGLFGVSINTSGKPISSAVVAVEYMNGQTMMVRDEIPWSALQPYEKKIGIPLKQIKYSSVKIHPVYVQLFGE